MILYVSIYILRTHIMCDGCFVKIARVGAKTLNFEEKNKTNPRTQMQSVKTLVNDSLSTTRASHSCQRSESATLLFDSCQRLSSTTKHDTT